MQDDGNVYYVEKILKKKTHPELMYLVKWEGYDISEATWEPLRNLEDVKYLIEEFENRQALLANKKRSRDHQIDFGKKTETSSVSNGESENFDENDKEQDKNYKKFRKNKMTKSEIVHEDIEEGNIPEKVINAKLIDKKLYCLVKYVERSDGIIPDDSYVPSSVLTEKCPRLLVDFYESKLKFL